MKHLEIQDANIFQEVDESEPETLITWPETTENMPQDANYFLMENIYYEGDEVEVLTI